MIKNYLTNSQLQLISLLTIALFLFGQPVSAQTITIGNGTVVNANTGYPAPYGNWYWGARHQFLILASELTAAGFPAPADITELAFDVVTPNGVALTNFEIKIGNTTASSITAWQTGLTSVYLSPSYTEVTGWNSHAFTSAFTWNGVDNLVIETCFNNSSFTNNAEVNQTVTPFVSSLYFRSDATGVCANTLTTGSESQRPNMQFQVAATAPPLCVVNMDPTNGATDFCPISATLSWAPDTNGGGPAFYQLYFGSDGAGLVSPTNILNGTNIGNVTSWTYGSNLTANTTYYWQVVPTNSMGTPINCSIFSFTTGIAPTIGATSADTNGICPGTPVNLSVNGYNGTLQWQYLDVSGWIDIGPTNTNPFTVMPALTTLYQAVVSNSACTNIPSFPPVAIVTVPSAVAGTATVTNDSICNLTNTTLQLMGSTGSVQWQSSTDGGVTWTNETGTGSTTTNYTVNPGASIQYWAILSSGNCAPDTSNIVSVVVQQVVAPSVVAGSRCGIGPVQLSASGNGQLNWYANPTGGSSLDTNLTYSPYVLNTDTFYVSSTIGGGPGGSSILITEIDLGGPDMLEIQNVTSGPIDVTGWKVAISNSYPTINTVNSIVQTLSGVMQPGEIKYWIDNTGANYWGNNMLWNPGAYPTFTGWAIILDASGQIVDFVPLNWLAADIQGMNTTIAGFPITIGTEWSGDGVNSTNATGGLSVSRQGNVDSNDSTNFVIQTTSTNTTNPGLTMPFQGSGCESPRTPVIATVNPAPAVAITASSVSLCQGDPSNLSVTSSNPAYVFTWSPAAGLSTTTGATTVATPQVPRWYYVIGDDGTCASIDSVFIDVGPPAVAGIATTPVDTICSGISLLLSLSGQSGNIQWQSSTNSGATWVNETGIGATTIQYIVTPLVNTSYHVVMSSAGCPNDTTNQLNIVPLVVTNPTTLGDVRCDTGVVNLSAAGSGNFYWYLTPSGGSPVNNGQTYSPTIGQTTTYYVQSILGGDFFKVGPDNNGFGNQGTITTANWGMRFDVNAVSTLDRVFVYPWKTGAITINLKDATGTLLNTITTNVVQFTGKTPIDLGFALTPGTGYKLELATGSVDLGRNTSGATYPYASPGSPATITGYFNPNAGTAATNYLFFYDWLVSTGCKSARVPVTGEVYTTPLKPIINQVGPSLVSSATSLNQWYFGGAPIAGATNQTYTPTQSGFYYVVLDNNGCMVQSDSLFFVYVGIEDPQYIQLEVYPNPNNGQFHVSFASFDNEDAIIQVRNMLGALVFRNEVHSLNGTYSEAIDISDLRQGIYSMHIKIGKNNYHQKMVVVK